MLFITYYEINILEDKKIYIYINRPQDYTVATELFFLRRKFVIEEVECSVILKYKSNSLTKHTDSTVRCL